MADSMAEVKKELADLEQEQSNLAQSIARLEAQAGADLASVPIGKLRAATVDQTRAAGQLPAERAAFAELGRRLAATRGVLANLEAAERAAEIVELEAQTTAAAVVFMGEFRRFLADLETFRAIYYKNREAGAKRNWPVTTYNWTMKRDYAWLGDPERLTWFEKALARAERGENDDE
jgi:hypothetical protein